MKKATYKIGLLDNKIHSSLRAAIHDNVTIKCKLQVFRVIRGPVNAFRFYE